MAGSLAQSLAVKIVEEGRPLADIIIPDDASPVVEYAAKELQSHLQASTGAKLDILKESSARTEGRLDAIYLGDTKAAGEAGLKPSQLPANAFDILATDHALYLAGRDGVGDPLKKDTTEMGTLFAVYRWLDEQLHIRWLWPGPDGMVVPQTAHVSMEPGKKTITPWSIHSRIRNWGSINGMSPEAREAYLSQVNTWFLRQSMARTADLDYGHGYGKYWERFGKEHPEYFALRPDGVRGPIDKRTNLVQLCVSNAGLRQQIIKDWLKAKEDEPRRPWINGIENDRREEDPFCTCEVCRSWDVAADPGQPQSYSDRYARFWLELQKEAKPYEANPKVIGYAYTDYSDAPKKTKLNLDIYVGVVPKFRYPIDAETEKQFREKWLGWKETGASLYLRPNYFLYGYAMPYIYACQFGEDLKFLQQNGLVGTDFDSLSGMWGVQGPNLYMLGRLHARPDLEVNDVLDEYYSGFGPAKDQVRAYFEYWEDVTKKFDAEFSKNNRGGWGIVSAAGDLIYTPEVLEQGQALLDKATTAAASDAGAQKKVQYLQTWLQHAKLCMDTLRSFRARKEGNSDPALNRKFFEAKKALDQFRKDNKEALSAANMGMTENLEVWSGWRSAK